MNEETGVTSTSCLFKSLPVSFGRHGDAFCLLYMTGEVRVTMSCVVSGIKPMTSISLKLYNCAIIHKIGIIILKYT